MATYKIEELDKEEIMHLTLPSAIAVITDVLNKAINKVANKNIFSSILIEYHFMSLVHCISHEKRT